MPDGWCEFSLVDYLAAVFCPCLETDYLGREVLGYSPCVGAACVCCPLFYCEVSEELGTCSVVKPVQYLLCYSCTLASDKAEAVRQKNEIKTV